MLSKLLLGMTLIHILKIEDIIVLKISMAELNGLMVSITFGMQNLKMY
jgi:hypothetical protein